jgi:hypothetical protein
VKVDSSSSGGETVKSGPLGGQPHGMGALLGALLWAGSPGIAGAQELVFQSADPSYSSDELETAMASTIDEEFKLSDQRVFLEQMAEATAMSARGVGVDYASNPQRFVLGGSVGSGVDGVGLSFGRGEGLLPAGGFAFSATAMAGLNLGAFAGDDSPARRFILYGNGMAGQGSQEPFGGSMANFGVHLQVMLVKARESGPAEWGGFALTSGFEHTRYTLELRQDVPMESSGFTWNADGSYSVTATSNTIPLELSTNMRLAFLTLFGGFALDIRPGNGATSDIELGGDVVYASNGQERVVGTATITDSQTADIGAIAPRFFFGPQINLSVVKVYGHLNVGVGGAFGGHAGVRIAL